jgi:DNA-binding response OmpR family regulator
MLISTRRLAAAVFPGPDHPDEAEGSHRQNGRAKPATIVLVEDEFLIRVSMADHLRDCGFRVLDAGSAAEAQTLFQSVEPIELMISDVNMPGMDGIALAQWVRSQFPDVRILLMSGDPANRGRLPGITFVEKPSTLESIERLVRKLLS